MKKLTPENIMFIALTVFLTALLIADKLGILKQFDEFLK